MGPVADWLVLAWGETRTTWDSVCTGRAVPDGVGTRPILDQQWKVQSLTGMALDPLQTTMGLGVSGRG
jgi:hypothetical protein